MCLYDTYTYIDVLVSHLHNYYGAIMLGEKKGELRNSASTIITRATRFHLEAWPW